MNLLEPVRKWWRTRLLTRYTYKLHKIHHLSFFLPRVLAPATEWDALSEELRGSTVVVSRHGLAAILRERRVLVLAEPGAGKSTWVHAVMLHLIEETAETFVPFYATLRNYQGNLRTLLESSESHGKLAKLTQKRDPSWHRVYLLDGIDEVPGEHIETFCADLAKLATGDSDAQLILTCRQGFYAQVRGKMPPGIAEFNLLPFSTEDIARFVEHEGLRPEHCFEELEKSDFGLEASNPFTLGTLASTLKAQGKLDPLRSGNLRIVVDALLAGRPSLRNQDARRALRLLAVAMEICARNVLTRDEALRILREGIQISPKEAEQLLEELSTYILLRTSAGYTFQMRSYGEFLAAEELALVRLDRILELVVFPGTRRRINRSWTNTVSYLVEMHEQSRRFFSLQHPEWVLNSSPAVFTNEERSEVVDSVLKNLGDSDAFLVGHQTIVHSKLARFVQQSDVPKLSALMNSGQPSRSGNALILLGHLKDATGLAAAVKAALDRTKTPALRHSAFIALAAGATPTLIPTLSAALDPADQMFDQILDCIGALMMPADIPHVLPLFGRTHTMLSTVFYRFASFRGLDALNATLDYLIGNPTAIRDDHISSYVEFPLRLLERLWNDAVRDKVVRLLLAWEADGIDDSLIRVLPAVTQIILSKDAEGDVSKQILVDLLKAKRAPQHLAHTLAQICTPTVATWLIGQGQPGKDLAASLAFRAPGETRNILGSVTEGAIAAQDDFRERYERENREREAGQQQQDDASRNAILNAPALDQVVVGFRSLGVQNWPQLEQARLDWLQSYIEDWLRTFDCLAAVSWINSRSFQITGGFSFFSLLLAIIEHYKFIVTQDLAIVQSLRGADEKSVVAYYNRVGFSIAAQAEFDRLFTDPLLPDGALYEFLEFLHGTVYTSPATQASLLAIANDSSKEEYIRRRAAQIFEKKASDGQLQTLSTTVQPIIAEIFIDALVGRQHVPTIKKQISILLADTTRLAATEKPFPYDSGILWVSSITTKDAWDLLTKLWWRTVQLSLPGCTRIVEAALFKLDPKALIELMRTKARNAVPETAESLLFRAGVYDSTREIDAAKSISFEQVVRRLAISTTLKKIKVGCEGPTDAPAFKSLLAKICGDRVEFVSVQPVGGWATALNPHYDFSPFLDGCLQAVFVMDGDNGREFNRPGRPLTEEAKRLTRKLDELKIPPWVLQRYGIENYFAQHALESVLNCDLSSSFPLPDDKPIATVDSEL